MEKYPSHTSNIVALKRIEGQVRGIQKMIESQEYCVDILNQVHSVMSALARVEDNILEKHFETCVANAVKDKTEAQRKQKLDEVMQLIRRFRKT